MPTENSSTADADSTDRIDIPFDVDAPVPAGIDMEDVAEHYEAMMELGANIKGEGEILSVDDDDDDDADVTGPGDDTVNGSVAS